MWIAEYLKIFWYILLIKVDTKSKGLMALVLLMVAGATVWKYDTFITNRDFMVYDQISCNPTLESCFVYVCEEGYEECDNSPFKKIEKNAKNITLCPNYNKDSCSALTCLDGEKECTITLCTDETLAVGEMCVFNPEAGVFHEIEDPNMILSDGSEQQGASIIQPVD